MWCGSSTNWNCLWCDKIHSIICIALILNLYLHLRRHIQPSKEQTWIMDVFPIFVIVSIHWILYDIWWWPIQLEFSKFQISGRTKNFYSPYQWPSSKKFQKYKNPARYWNISKNENKNSIYLFKPRIWTTIPTNPTSSPKYNKILWNY